MSLKVNDGHEFNCASPRNLVAILMIMVELKLEYLVLIKNISVSSVYNPVEYNVGGCNFGIQPLHCARLESTTEVDNKTKKVKSIKQFVERNMRDKALMKDLDDVNQQLMKSIML